MYRHLQNSGLYGYMFAHEITFCDFYLLRSAFCCVHSHSTCLYMHIFKFKSVIFLPYESQNLMQKHLWETFAKMVIAVCGLCTVACVFLDNFV